jgi:hypothetical protein
MATVEGIEPPLRVLETPALPLRHTVILERVVGLEPTTFSLARKHSTN